MKYLTLCLCAFFLSALAADFSATAAPEAPIYQNPSAPVEARVQDVISRLTLDEKISLLSGSNDGDLPGFHTTPIPRLGIPSIKMNDGPMGAHFQRSTAFPSGILLGASFDPDLVAEVSTAIAEETKAYGHNMLLGPCIDISRQPFGGRNFESYGEDPYLTSQMASHYVKGLQSKGVLASTKHFALNDQEFHRNTINVIADERTMQEIHLPAFHAAVDAGTWTIMASYNLLNGLHASENPDLLTKKLKQDWGFQGLVVSDWEATHSTIAAAKAGLDLEMPSAIYFGDALMQAVQKQEVSLDLINDKVARILRPIFGAGIYDNQASEQPDPSQISSPAHLAVAQKAAAAGLVLLKNDGNILPLNANKLRSLAVIGAGANFSRTGGSGSSQVDPTRVITPLAALHERLQGQNVAINYAVGAQMRGDFTAIPASLWITDPKTNQPGVKAEYFDNIDLSGAPAVTRIDPNINFHWQWGSPAPGIIPKVHFSARWTGYITAPATDTFLMTMICDDGARLYVNDHLLIDQWHDQAVNAYSAPVQMVAGKTYKIVMEYFQDGGDDVAGLGMSATGQGTDLQQAVQLASHSDAAVIFAGLSAAFEGEGFDRSTLALPDGQDDLITQVAAVNPNTIVVINAGNPVLMPWLSQVKGLIYAWYPGQEGGYAIADALLGTVNPSGKLPISFPKRWEDSSAYGAYPQDKGDKDQVSYSEGIYVGYRHFDTHHVEPLFPFGFGLSYTNFAYSDIMVTNLTTNAPSVDVTFTLHNSGSVAGAEVAQLYLGEVKPAVDRPLQELKGFKKVFLQPGESQKVTIHLDKNSFSYFNGVKNQWLVNPGTYNIRIGSSSRDIRLNSSVAIQ